MLGTTATIAGISTAGVWILSNYRELLKRQQQVQNGWKHFNVQTVRHIELARELLTKLGNPGEKLTEASVALQHTFVVPDTVAPTAEKLCIEAVRLETLRIEELQRYLVTLPSQPDRDAAVAFIQTKDALAETEGRLQFARQYYNDAAGALNDLLQHFPARLIALVLGVGSAPYFPSTDGAKIL